MFVSKFSVENWIENHNQGFLEQVQNWTEVETAIRELDGHHKTLVTLETEGETHMAIGGGPDRYIVYVTFDNKTFYYLVEPSKSDTTESLVVGGQEGIYPAKLCVDLKTTLKAANTFAKLGTMDRSVIWQQEGVVEPV